jgi:glycosyltransferase involved in cell wall biosynthesis
MGEEAVLNPDILRASIIPPFLHVMLSVAKHLLTLKVWPKPWCLRLEMLRLRLSMTYSLGGIMLVPSIFATMGDEKSLSPIPVLFCTDGIYPHSVGGMQRHSRLLIEALAKTGALDITVLHPHPGERLFADFPQVKEIALPPLPGKRHYLRELYAYSKLVLAQVEAHPKHLVYAQGLSVWAGINKVGHRTIINPHGLEPYQTLTYKEYLKTAPYRWVFGRLFRRAARVISLGGRLTKILQNAGRPENVVVLPNATNPVARPAAELIKHSAKPMRLLFVGRFAHNKGIGILLEAVRQLNAEGHAPAFLLDLVGKGPLFDAMQAQYPLPNVHFHGFMDDAGLDRVYLDDHVFVFPTLFEGMPTVVLEAMARAMPVIVTDTGATLELVDATNGIIIQKGDVADLKLAILRLIQLPPTEFAQLSAAGHAKMLARFTWEAVAARHIDLFREMWHSL